jgi:hypothetical protein
MSKIAFVADVHIGNHKRFGGPLHKGINDRCRKTLSVFSKALQRADSLGCEVFVVCGDLLDSSRPDVRIVSEVGLLLGYGFKPFIRLLLGNHEIRTDEKGDNSLCVFDQVSKRIAVDDTACRFGGFGGLGMMPYQTNGKSFLDKKDIYALVGDNLAIGLHLGIEDGNTEEWLKDTNDSIKAEVLQEFMDTHGVTYAFAGNWHDHKIIGNIHQIGALCPTGFNNPGPDYGYMAVLDTETRKVSYETIEGPRFLKVKGCEVPAMPENCTDLYVELHVDPDEAEDARELVKQCKIHESITDGSVRVIPPKAKEIAKRVSEVRSAKSRSEAIVSYVDTMNVQSEWKEEIISNVNSYLGAK